MYLWYRYFDEEGGQNGITYTRCMPYTCFRFIAKIWTRNCKWESDITQIFNSRDNHLQVCFGKWHDEWTFRISGNISMMWLMPVNKQEQKILRHSILTK